MTELAELWSWRNGTRAADYTFHLIDCRHNDTMAAIRGMDCLEETVRALAMPYQHRTPAAREDHIMARYFEAQTRARAL